MDYQTLVESLYSSDPFLEDPYEEQSLAEMLASQDFSSCELDKVSYIQHTFQ